MQYYRCGTCWSRNLHATVSIRLSCRGIAYEMWLYRFQLVTGRTWKGSAFGGVKGRTEIPGIVDGSYPCSRRPFFDRAIVTCVLDYLNGTLWVEEFVSHHQTLDNINKGFDDMHVSS